MWCAVKDERRNHLGMRLTEFDSGPPWLPVLFLVGIFLLIVFLTWVLFATKAKAAGVEWSDQVPATIAMEAIGEGQKGMEGVALVIRNRTRRPTRFGNSAEEIVRKPFQFSCWNNYPATYNVWEQRSGWESSLEDARNVWLRVKGGLVRDWTNGADHYYNPRKCSPSWAPKMEVTATWKNHKFLKE